MSLPCKCLDEEEHRLLGELQIARDAQDAIPLDRANPSAEWAEADERTMAALTALLDYHYSLPEAGPRP